MSGAHFEKQVLALLMNEFTLWDDVSDLRFQAPFMAVRISELAHMAASLADSPEVAELVRKAVEAERARCAGIAERDGFALLKEADAWWKDKMPRAAADATAQSKSGPRIAAAIRAPADEAEGG